MSRFEDSDALKRRLYELKKLPAVDQTRNIRSTHTRESREDFETTREYKKEHRTATNRDDHPDTWSVKTMREALEEIVQKREKINLVFEGRSPSGKAVPLEQTI